MNGIRTELWDGKRDKLGLSRSHVDANDESASGMIMLYLSWWFVEKHAGDESVMQLLLSKVLGVVIFIRYTYFLKHEELYYSSK